AHLAEHGGEAGTEQFIARRFGREFRHHPLPRGCPDLRHIDQAPSPTVPLTCSEVSAPPVSPTCSAPLCASVPACLCALSSSASAILPCPYSSSGRSKRAHASGPPVSPSGLGPSPSTTRFWPPASVTGLMAMTLPSRTSCS